MTRKHILISTLLLLAAPLVTADEAADLERRRAEGFLAAVAAGDAEALAATLGESFSPKLLERRDEARWLDMARQLTARHVGLQVESMDAGEPHHIEATTSDARSRVLFTFDFEPEPPHRIAGLGLDMLDDGPRGPELPPAQIPDGAGEGEIAKTLGDWFAELARQDLFSGTALVAHDGKAFFTTVYGLASRSFNVPNRIDTRFDLGSINKDFTKVAVGQLAAQGKLSLDDTIAQHLPDYPNSEVAAKVTVRQLLNHTSGLGDIFNEKFFRSSRALYRQPRDFFPVFADEPLQFEPGSDQSYSNAGYMVLGEIIHAASGQEYAEYVIEHVFAPAGMTDTGFFAHDEPVPNVAVGYTRWRPEGPDGDLRNNLFSLPIRGNSAGSAQSTVEDLLRFDNALRGHRLLSPAWTAWYFDGPEPRPGADEPKAERVHGHLGIAGGAPGVNAVLESDGTVTLIVLSNYDPPIAESIMRKLWRPLTRALAEEP